MIISMRNMKAPRVIGIIPLARELHKHINAYQSVLTPVWNNVIRFYNHQAGVELRHGFIIPIPIDVGLKEIQTSENLPALVFEAIHGEYVNHFLSDDFFYEDPWKDTNRMWPDTMLVWVPGGGGFAGAYREGDGRENVHVALVGEYGVGPHMRAIYPELDLTKSSVPQDKYEDLIWANTPAVAESTMVHEFGHTFNLPDRYHDKDDILPRDIMGLHDSYKLHNPYYKGFRKEDQFVIRADALVMSPKERPQAVDESWWNYGYSRYLRRWW